MAQRPYPLPQPLSSTHTPNCYPYTCRYGPSGPDPDPEPTLSTSPTQTLTPTPTPTPTLTLTLTPTLLRAQLGTHPYSDRSPTLTPAPTLTRPYSTPRPYSDPRPPPLHRHAAPLPSRISFSGTNDP